MQIALLILPILIGNVKPSSAYKISVFKPPTSVKEESPIKSINTITVHNSSGKWFGMMGLYARKGDGVWFGVACDDERIFATTFGFNKETVLRSLLRSIPFGVPFQHSEKLTPLAERVLDLIKDIYDGEEVSRGFSLATGHLSDYAKNVIKVASLIPLGYVASYGSVAEVAGGSPRAVGRVMALNPFPLIVPCHRVVCSDLRLGGYGLGLDVKLEILRRENKGYASKREVQANGKKLQLFPVGFVLKRLEKGKC